MVAVAVDRLVDDYLRWLKENLRTEEVRDGAVVIATPFLDRHSDEIEIYVEQQNGGLRLSDDGYTVRDFRAGGVDLMKGARHEQLLRILNGYGVHLEADELWVKAGAQDFAHRRER